MKLLGAVAKPATDRLKRQEGVVATLRKAGLAPEVPPSDFRGVYTYTVVEYCYGKPEPVLRLFQNEYVRAAFEKSFATGEAAHLDREIDEILQWNDETGALGRIDYNLAREVTGFSVVFNRLVDRTRTAAETRMEREVRDVKGGVRDVQESLSTLVKRLDRMNSREEILRQEGPDRSPLSHLAYEVREWFAAVEYKILSEPESGPDEFVWLVRVPARRGFETVLVLGRSGELNAPDVERAAGLVATHHAAEGWVIVPQRISPAARVADEDLDQIYCYTLDELIDERADFEPYLTWLENEVRSRGIDQRYVPLSCFKEEPDKRTGRVAASSHYSWREGGLDDYVRAWVDDNAKEHLSILGEFGMGKSWFSLHFAYTVAQEWRAAKAAGRKRPRLPLVIPLRDYAKAVSLESLFSEFFFRKHEILPNGYRVFETLNRMGRLLLIFDGFDEMAARVDRQAMINNFWELARAVVPGSKVLLTCRTEHFPEAQEGRNLLGARLVASTAALTGEPPQFEVVELKPFDDDQIFQMLERLTTEETRETILRNKDLVDLMRRPVMADLVLTALPRIEGGAKVDIARVYLYAVQHKIDADIRAERTFTSLADKVFFLCELSWFMLTESMLSINYRAIPDHIRAWFGPAVQEQRDLDHWHYDMLGQTMLVRNAEGDYTPAHRSLLEFFAAYKIAAELGIMNTDFMALVGATKPTEAPSFRWSKLPSIEIDVRVTAGGWLPEDAKQHTRTLSGMVLDDAVFDLMLPMLTGDVIEPLVEMLMAASALGAETSGTTGANIIEILGRLDRTALRGRRLDGVVLREAELERGGHGMDLAGCSLRRADLADVGLEDVDLSGADLEEADFTVADHLGFDRKAVAALARLWNADFVFGVSRDYRVYEWDLTNEPVQVFAAPDDVSGAMRLSGGATLVVYSDLTTASGHAGAMLDPVGGEVRYIPIEGSAGDVWETEGRSYLLQSRRFDVGTQFSVQDLATGNRESESLIGALTVTFEVNASGRVFGLSDLRDPTDGAPGFGPVVVFEMLMERGQLTYVERRTVDLSAQYNTEIELFGDSGVGLLLVEENLSLAIGLVGIDADRVIVHGIPPSIVRSGNLYLNYPEFPGRRFALNGDGTLVALSVGGGVVVLALNNPSKPILVIGPDRRVTSYALTQDDKLVVADAYGGLTAYDVRSGVEIADVHVGTKMRGAILRGATGIDPAARNQLERAGAIFD
ncbi:NACHT domain-containing protein [Actinoplanes sp. LDG1-06]|uniref:NACHT domain-containing protein n=1 Tax=Paractinoplanes ovalisporus TaxID=2810368 RepID=A0ABS2AQP1_9ACTN|nr:NACHT domain-containing protein [Actinoplanes ovalisporus]MBM2622134.1 NACHT domain-containing protein [Actinoplanes ovalisporus]